MHVMVDQWSGGSVNKTRDIMRYVANAKLVPGTLSYRWEIGPEPDTVHLFIEGEQKEE